MIAQRLLLLALAIAAAIVPLAVLADPPGRVGRVSLLEGQALLRLDRQDAGQAASLNWPIAGGAILDTDPGSRAEIWVGSTTLRLGSQTRVEFSTLDDEHVVLNQGQGALSITLRDTEQAAETEAYTPNGRIRFDGLASIAANGRSARENFHGGGDAALSFKKFGF
jgi:hypothetical protein